MRRVTLGQAAAAVLGPATLDAARDRNAPTGNLRPSPVVALRGCPVAMSRVAEQKQDGLILSALWRRLIGAHAAAFRVRFCFAGLSTAAKSGARASTSAGGISSRWGRVGVIPGLLRAFM